MWAGYRHATLEWQELYYFQFSFLLFEGCSGRDHTGAFPFSLLVDPCVLFLPELGAATGEGGSNAMSLALSSTLSRFIWAYTTHQTYQPCSKSDIQHHTCCSLVWEVVASCVQSGSFPNIICSSNFTTYCWTLLAHLQRRVSSLKSCKLNVDSMSNDSTINMKRHGLAFEGQRCASSVPCLSCSWINSRPKTVIGWLLFFVI